MGSEDNKLSGLVKALQVEVCQGLLYTHARLNDNTKKILESTAFLYALIELLSEQGLLSIEELDERKRIVAERLVKKFTESGLGLMYQDPECDKYNFEPAAELDCGSRVHICRAICCKLPFALSRQDVAEGIIRWKFGRPYLIAHGDDGYCLHFDRKSLRCTAHEHRPMPCRGFDCRENDRWQVWLDYERMVLNEDLLRLIYADNRNLYRAGEGVQP